MNEERNRIPSGTAMLMLGTAVLIDVIQGLLTGLFIGLFVSPFISAFAWLSFYVWNKIRGVGFMDSFSKFGLRKALAAIASLLEFAPGINALPGWTLSTFLLIGAVRAEDEIYNRTGREIRITRKELERVAGLRS